MPSAVLSIVVAGAFGRGLDERLATIPLSPADRAAIWAQRSQLSGAEPSPGVEGGVRAAVERAIDEAFVGGFRLAMVIAAGLALASAFSAALLIEGKGAPAPQSPRVTGARHEEATAD